MLIPWRRNGEKQRVWCWDVAKPWLEALGYPMFIGEPKGEEWSRAEAVNAAAKAAKRWDIAIVNDSDTLADAGSLRRAIAWVQDTRGGVRPHMDRWELTKDATLRVAQGTDPRTLDATERTSVAGGGQLVIHREAFEAIGGYDETWRGWGYEDSSTNLALLRTSSFDRLPGECWHLWHDPTGWAKRSKDSVRKHKELMRTYAPEIAAFMGNKGWKLPADQIL